MTSEWLDEKGVRWCYRSDSAKFAKNEEPFVINLDDKGKEGTHWTAAKRTGNTLFYADPFGTVLNGYPPKELSDLRLREVVNSKAWQRPLTNYCGYYAYLITKVLRRLPEKAGVKDMEKEIWKEIRKKI